MDGAPLTYLLEDASAAQYIHGIAWHCYNGDLRHVSEFHERYPQAARYMTECSGGSWQNGSPSYLSAELWLLFASMNNWLRRAITWNVALDPAGGPSNNGSPSCRGVVTIAPDTGEVTYNADFYALGHLSKFWRPGAFSVSVASDLPALNTAAYQNANGETVLLVENTRSSEVHFWAHAGALGFVATVPAGATITYVWREPP